MSAVQQKPHYNGNYKLVQLIKVLICVIVTVHSGGERNAVGRDELLDSTPLATHTQGPFEHTTFLTQLSTPTAYIVANSATNEQAQPSSSVFRAVNEATSSQSGEQLDYSKAQLVVAILALVGVGKVFESLGKVVWKKCKKVGKCDEYARSLFFLSTLGPIKSRFRSPHQCGLCGADLLFYSVSHITTAADFGRNRWLVCGASPICQRASSRYSAGNNS